MASSGFIPSLLAVVRDVILTVRGTVGSGVSLADISKVARIEPITLVSSSVTNVKELDTILHGVLNIYTAYYLQAVHILSAQLKDVRILKILDKTNPDRDLKTVLATGHLGTESYNAPYNAPFTHLINSKTLSLEGYQYKLPATLSQESLRDDAPDGVDSSKRIESFDKLGSAIGKVVNVSFCVNRKDGEEGSTVNIPVVVKLDTMILPSDVMTMIVASSQEDISFSSRFKDALAGRIGFVKDFILCSDLIKAQKKTLLKDPTGYYAQVLARLSNSKMYSILTGNVSLAGISSVYVISDEEESQIQRKIGGKLTNASTRRIVFDNTSAMMIVVISKEWERVSIYIRDVDGFTQSSFSSFKDQASNKSGDQIADILKAFSISSAPSF